MNDSGMRFNHFKEIFSLISNIFVTIGVMVAIFAMIVAYMQYQQIKQLDKKRFAIEAINTTNETQFIKAYTRLKTIANNFKFKTYNKELLKEIYNNSNYVKNKNFVIDDINLVLITYNNISMLYFNNLANQGILETGIYAEIREFSKILGRVSTVINKEFQNPKFEALLNELIKKDWFPQEKLARKIYEPKYSDYL